YVILRHLLALELSMMVCINPSSILLLAELANEHAESLIRDIYTGGLRDGLALTDGQYAFFRGRLQPDRDRARQLARALARPARPLPLRHRGARRGERPSRPDADDLLRPEGQDGDVDHGREDLREPGDRGDAPRRRAPAGTGAVVLRLLRRPRRRELQALRR